MARLSERTKTSEHRLDAVVTVIERLAQDNENLGKRLEELREIQKRNEEGSDRRFKALDERLNILMNVVERHVTENGHQHKPE